MSAQKSTLRREQWTGQYGFVIAAIGSAIGLGNIWRFPGVAYANGGGAFLIPYLVALLTAGIPILLMDYVLGHRYRGSAPATFRRVHRNMEVVGWFQVIVSLVIMTYYAVILAWAVRYVFFSMNEAWGDDTATFFVSDFLKVSEPGMNAEVVPGIFWPLVLVWVGAAVIIILGVTRGLEKASRFFIPLLVVIFLALVVRALFLEGAAEGLNSFFTPNWAALGDAQVWVAAYSQIFFSLSVAFGIMLTYASYLKKDSDIAGTGLVAGFANSSFEILAGIGVFATLGFMATQAGVGVDELEGLSGPILSFVTFPKVISMMPGGAIFGIIFFLSLAIAGFTSLISLIQVVSAAFQEKFGISRRLGGLIATGIAGTGSVFVFSTTNGLNALDVVDYFINNLGIVGSAILQTALIAVVVRKLPLLRQHLNHYSSLPVGKWWYLLVAVVSPAVLLVTFVMTIRGLLTGGYGEYPESFLYQFGWGLMVGVVVVSVVLTFVRWRTPVDDYDQVEFHDDEATTDYFRQHHAEKLQRWAQEEREGRAGLFGLVRGRVRSKSVAANAAEPDAATDSAEGRNA